LFLLGIYISIWKVFFIFSSVLFVVVFLSFFFTFVVHRITNDNVTFYVSIPVKLKLKELKTMCLIISDNNTENKATLKKNALQPSSLVSVNITTCIHKPSKQHLPHQTVVLCSHMSTNYQNKTVIRQCHYVHMCPQTIKTKPSSLVSVNITTCIHKPSKQHRHHQIVSLCYVQMCLQTIKTNHSP
jgi:hypothetical protein